VESTPWGMGDTCPPLLRMAVHGGQHEYKISKQETDQTVLTIKKMTNCARRDKKSGGTRQFFFQKHVPPLLTSFGTTR